MLGQIISFTSMGSYDPDGEVTEFRWTFGDGLGSYDRSPKYQYSEAGNYTITLQVKDNNGAIGIDTTECMVNLPPSEPDSPSESDSTASPEPEPPTGNITIRLHNDELKQSGSNVKITSIAQPTGQESIEGYINSTGMLVFHNILTGNYTFQASTEGYEDLEFDFEVLEDASRRKTIILNAVESPASQPEEKLDSQLPIILAFFIVSLAIIIIFFRSRKKEITVDEILDIASVAMVEVDVSTIDGVWNPFHYVEENSGMEIPVGEWINEYFNDERRMFFKPNDPLKKDNSEVWKSLEGEIAKHGRGMISTEGVIIVNIPKDATYSDLLKKIGHTYYTLRTRAILNL
jgi:PKD repeat protein